MNNIFKIIEFVTKWQLENDSNFKVLPTDEHASLVFNHENQIYKFIFSNKLKRDDCRLRIPKELLVIYNHMLEQEDGFTYYLFTKGDK